LEPIGVEWHPIAIHLDLERLKKYGEDKFQPAIALLLLVLRDFANRKIPIGYGTNRGMGTVEVTEMCMNCSPIGELAGIEGKTAIAPDLSNFNDQVLSDLTTAWQTWIVQHQEAA
jgi:CRISPR/Cas system CSM-associated protein Csm3 (group 7 of RAMP superfamily)